MDAAGRVRLERPATSTLSADGLGTRIVTWETVWEGRAQIVLETRTGIETDSAGRPVTVMAYFVRFPIDVAPLPGDRVTSVVSHDPLIVGSRFAVTAVEGQDFAEDRTARLARTI